MVCSRFRLRIAARVVLLAVTLAAAGWLVSATTMYVTAGLIIGAAVVQAICIMRDAEKTTGTLVRFFESVRFGDASQSFTAAGEGFPFDDLNAELTRVMDTLRSGRAQAEESRRWLETVVQHVGIGLISYRSDGTVEFVNNAAKRLLNAPSVGTIQSLDAISPELAAALSSAEPGSRKLVRIQTPDGELHLTVHTTGFQLGGNDYILASFNDIRDELEEKEMTAWQNLIRVLTHEIMNSVTPIVSLASTVDGLLQEAGEGESAGIVGNDDTAQDVRSAVETIRKRSEGLLHFVDNYRSLTRVPKPRFSVFPAADLFARVGALVETRIGEADITFMTSADPADLELNADPDLIEQVLINLLINAVDAVGDRSGSRIRLEGSIDDSDRAVIRVIDNGPGIVGEVIEKVFIPFFTTKPEGSGISLSLSRQIMRAHGGSITVWSKPNVETVFTLRF